MYKEIEKLESSQVVEDEIFVPKRRIKIIPSVLLIVISISAIVCFIIFGIELSNRAASIKSMRATIQSLENQYYSLIINSTLNKHNFQNSLVNYAPNSQLEILATNIMNCSTSVNLVQQTINQTNNSILQANSSIYNFSVNVNKITQKINIFQGMANPLLTEVNTLNTSIGNIESGFNLAFFEGLASNYINFLNQTGALESNFKSYHNSSHPLLNRCEDLDHRLNRTMHNISDLFTQAQIISNNSIYTASVLNQSSGNITQILTNEVSDSENLSQLTMNITTANISLQSYSASINGFNKFSNLENLTSPNIQALIFENKNWILNLTSSNQFIQISSQEFNIKEGGYSIFFGNLEINSNHTCENCILTLDFNSGLERDIIYQYHLKSEQIIPISYMLPINQNINLILELSVSNPAWNVNNTDIIQVTLNPTSYLNCSFYGQ